MQKFAEILLKWRHFCGKLVRYKALSSCVTNSDIPTRIDSGPVNARPAKPTHAVLYIHSMRICLKALF